MSDDLSSSEVGDDSISSVVSPWGTAGVRGSTDFDWRGGGTSAVSRGSTPFDRRTSRVSSSSLSLSFGRLITPTLALAFPFEVTRLSACRSTSFARRVPSDLGRVRRSMSVEPRAFPFPLRSDLRWAASFAAASFLACAVAFASF
jgi:hypothetical protein